MTKYTKKEAASVVIEAASKYEKELLNKSLLFVCMDKHKRIFLFECSFRKRNFLHLTGLDVVASLDENGVIRKLTASEFFDRCISKTLRLEEFEFANDGNTHLKLGILPQMMCKNLSATMIGDYDTYTPKLQTDKLVGKIDGIVGFSKDEVEGIFLPKTLLKADIRDLSKSILRVVATFRKNIDDVDFTELTYKAKKVEWDKVKFPDDYVYLKNFFYKPVY